MILLEEKHVVMKKENFLSWLKKLKACTKEDAVTSIDKIINEICFNFKVGQEYTYSGGRDPDPSICKCVHEERGVYFFWDFKLDITFNSDSENFQDYTFTF